MGRHRARPRAVCHALVPLCAAGMMYDLGADALRHGLGVGPWCRPAHAVHMRVGEGAHSGGPDAPGPSARARTIAAQARRQA